MSSASAQANASCPASGRAGSITTIASTHSWYIINDSDGDIYFSAETSISDDQNNHASDGIYNQLLPAHNSVNGNHNLYLNATYDPGPVNVTAATTVYGGASAVDHGYCAFMVYQQQAPTFRITPIGPREE